MHDLGINKRVLVLNSCQLGEAETRLWNSLFESFGDECHVTFFSTTLSTDLVADEFINIRYDLTSLCNLPEIDSPHLKSLVRKVALKHKIWEEYKEGDSEQLAYFWLVAWTVIVRSLEPSAVIIWNGHRLPEAALYEVCNLEGVDVLVAERGPFAETFSFDPLGFNFESSFNRRFDRYAAGGSNQAVFEFASRYFSEGRSNWGQPSRYDSGEEFRKSLEIPSGKTVVFFPTQLDRDTNAKLHSPNYKSSLAAYVAIAEWCNAHFEDVYLLTKGHPLEESIEEYEQVEVLSGKFVTDVHIFDCIQFCDCVVSVNSSAAIEATLAGKPVLLLGRSILEHANGVKVLLSRADLAKALGELVASLPDQGLSDATEFFRKLIFSYLFTAKNSYLELGIKPITEITELVQTREGKSKVLISQVVAILRLIVPNLDTPSIQLERSLQANTKLKRQLDSIWEEVNMFRTNLMIRVLRKLRLIPR